MTLKNRLLKEIDTLDMSHKRKLESLEVSEDTSLESLEEERKEAISSLNDEFTDIDILTKETANILNAPQQSKRLHTKYLETEKDINDKKKHLHRMWGWHIAKIIGSVILIICIPTIIGGGSLALSIYCWDSNKPFSELQELLGLVFAFITIFGTLASLIALIWRVNYHCDHSTYRQDIRVLKKQVSSQHSDLISLKTQIAVQIQNINKYPYPLISQLKSLRGEYKEKIELLEREFDNQCESLHREYSEQRNELKDNYKTRRKALVMHLEELKQQVPDISLSIPTKQFTKNKYGQAYFRFYNDSFGEAKDLAISFEGFYEGKKEAYIRKIKPKETEELKIAIKPTEHGEMEWSVKAEFEDVLGRTYTKLWNYWVDVTTKSGTSSTVVIGRDYIGGDRTSIEDSVLHRTSVK